MTTKLTIDLGNVVEVLRRYGRDFGGPHLLLEAPNWVVGKAVYVELDNGFGSTSSGVLVWIPSVSLAEVGLESA